MITAIRRASGRLLRQSRQHEVSRVLLHIDETGAGSELRRCNLGTRGTLRECLIFSETEASGPQPGRGIVQSWNKCSSPVNDLGMGRGAKIVSGTVRDSLHMIDVIFGLDGGDLPEIVVSDTASYSDVVFGLLELLGISYRPALADLPDQKGWRIRADADYGPLSAFARGRIDTAKIRRHWEDILRVVASIYTGTVRAYDVVTMLQRDGHPTALGEAIAMYGRIFKTLHILSYIDVDETYRRDIKAIRNLQEGRHALGRKICHGRKGELYHRYERGLENQLGSLGLVLNCVTLWTTVYLDAAVRQLRSQGYPVRDEDMARLSPFVDSHLGVHGSYTFTLPDLEPGGIRELRDPDAPGEDEE